MSHRFFSQDPISADQLCLADDQAHHLIHVMRFKIGQQVTVFDGSGFEAIAEIIEMNKRQVTVKVLERNEVSRELAVELVVAVSLPKGDRQKFLVEKLVEVGVQRLIPLKSQRSVAQPSPKAIERLQKSVIAASKQCERNSLMKIEPECGFAELCVQRNEFSDFQKLIATTHGESCPLSSIGRAEKYLVVIGPEGGFSLEENELAIENDFLPVRLGPAILRTETAAVVSASFLGLSATSADS